MDHVQDLTARAVSFIIFMQDTLLKGSVYTGQTLSSTTIRDVFGVEFTENFKRCFDSVKKYEERPARMLQASQAENQAYTDKHFSVRNAVFELVWISEQSPVKATPEMHEAAEAYLLEICNDLSVWITRNVSSFTTKQEDLFDAFATPQTWRKAISRCLYQSRQERIQLSEDLEYLPIQLVLALGGCGYNAKEQRILQWWQAKKKKAAIPLTQKEQLVRQNFFEVCYNSFQDERKIAVDPAPLSLEALQLFYEDKIKKLLSEYAYVTERLLQREAPLSFHYILAGELEEIKTNRDLRSKECLVKTKTDERVKKATLAKEVTVNIEAPEDSHEKEKNCDPKLTAQDMQLFALAFSGGGIRSATFNLGILQGLSKQCVLSHVDYLSTVSGGGYIGSWLATWVKRSGSLSKVQDRLNPEVSPDPLGEEVRPIRWLRMFSNYLTPNKSIMSIDSWTMGITWLRNTLLNQVVILLALLPLMLLFKIGFQLWNEAFWGKTLAGIGVYVVSCIFLAAIAYLTGLGMQWYNNGTQPSQTARLQQKQNLTSFISGIAVAGAFLVSAAMYVPLKNNEVFLFREKLPLLLPAAGVTFLILLGIALLGQYDKCIRAMDKEKATGKNKLRPYRIIVGTALLASVVGWLALAESWKLLSFLTPAHFASDKSMLKEPDELAFTVGVPLILFVFGLTVVARMAFLGKYFPDERREWWGRMGAVINRIAFLWLLLSASITLLDDVLKFLIGSWNAPASVGGWMVLLAGAVKAAYNGKTSGKTEAKGFQAMALDILSKAAPYLFALGLLIFLPHIADWLINKKLNVAFLDDHASWKALFYAVIFFLSALYLSTRLGVNEFSMHHFYKNRLVRAYLGAARSRTIRDKTMNPFTGFDKLDDEKLSLFRSCQGYYGPYPVLSAALNASQVTDFSRQDRKAESFIFSPLFSGFDFSKVRASANQVTKSYDYGYRPTSHYAYPNDNGPGIGTAMAISGAAANPNMGYHSSPGTAFLLTVFNAQLGWWIGNPRKDKWKESDPQFGLAYLFNNMIGQTNTSNDFVCLSDGGHFDNMGLYEMIRRRCAVVVVCDAEQDENFTCEGLANAIRRCRIDFGAEISIDIEDIVKRDGRFSKKHYALGTIGYSGDTKPSGVLLYVKASITGDEPVDVQEYATKNETFPHQSTGDQFFDEQQFESYRKLGMHIADKLLADQAVVDALKLNFRVATGSNGKVDTHINQRKVYLPKSNFSRSFYKRYTS